MTRLATTAFGLLCFLNIAMAAPADDFVSTWKTDNPGTSNATSITVPMVGGPYDVDWDNDGTFDEFAISGPVTHDYGVAGTHAIKVRGIYDSIQFNDEGDKEKILSIDQWGTNAWTSMNAAFYGAINLQVPAIDNPDFSGVTDMSRMFTDAISADPDTSAWDTSAVTTMRSMFYGATSANPNTSGWDTAAVTIMRTVFFGATAANPDTSDWDTTSVTNMIGMFRQATSANPDTSNWDTSAVDGMTSMFYEATSANPDTSGWDTSALYDASWMFLGATSFDGDISSWDVTSLKWAGGMFEGIALSVVNYESLLISWNAQNLQQVVLFGGGNSTYCSAAAIAARANMIISDRWEITDGGACELTNPGVAPDLTPETDSGVSDNDNLTSIRTPYFYVNCTDIENTITLFTHNPAINTVVETYTCKTVGINVLPVKAPLLVGDHTITFTEQNSLGTTENSPSLGITIIESAPSEHFVTTWRTDDGSIHYHDKIIEIPMIGGPFDVDWDNDGIFDEFGLFGFYDEYGHLTGNARHTFEEFGVYTIRIHGAFESIFIDDSNDANKILSVDQWGTESWTTAERSFAGTHSLEILANDIPDFSAVTNMRGMFFKSGASPDFRGWDTSMVTDMALMFFDSSGNPNTSGLVSSIVTTLYGMFTDADFANPDTSGWDTLAVTDMGLMFHGAKVANPDTSGWNTAAVTNMSKMFSTTELANPDTSGWNTAAVTNMSEMFTRAESANPDTSNWDTSKVTDMKWMFSGAETANPNTSGWETAAVINMHGLFNDAVLANPDTSAWDTAAVQDMGQMFRGAKIANPITSGWDTSSVIYMDYMFSAAYLANPDTSGWDTSAVRGMYEMFAYTKAFDQDIGSWDVTALTGANRMFHGTALSTTNYESLLIGWDAQNLSSGVLFSAGQSTYCSAAAFSARANMITSDSWLIGDGGQVCSTCNLNTVSGATEYFDASYEACEILVVGPSVLAADGAALSLSSGWAIDLLPGFSVEKGATLSAKVCGQSLCMTSIYPMPYGCHSCVDQICDIDPTCCELEFDQACLDQVDTVCNLVCE